MFTPLTIAIFSGALSPSCLEGQRYVSERIQQSVRKLMNLPGSLDGLTDQLKGYCPTGRLSYRLLFPLPFFHVPFF